MLTVKHTYKDLIFLDLCLSRARVKIAAPWCLDESPKIKMIRNHLWIISFREFLVICVSYSPPPPGLSGLRSTYRSQWLDIDCVEKKETPWEVAFDSSVRLPPTPVKLYQRGNFFPPSFLRLIPRDRKMLLWWRPFSSWSRTGCEMRGGEMDFIFTGGSAIERCFL